MKVKSFFADRIHDALAAAHKQLGPDAVLLSSHRAPAESRHLGAFEVVCGCRETTDQDPAPDSRATRLQATGATVHDRGRDTSFIEELLSVAPAAIKPPGSKADVTASPARGNTNSISWQQVELGLLDEGFPASLAGEMVRGLKCEMGGRTTRPGTLVGLSGSAQHRHSGTSVTQLRLQLRSLLPLLDDCADPEPVGSAPASRPRLPSIARTEQESVSLEDLDRNVRSLLGGRLRQPSAGLRNAEGIDVLALVGPCGSGKTLLALKLAADATIRSGRSVRLVAVASSTPGSTRRMESVSTLVGCPFSLVEKPEELSGACMAQAERELLIIDTPGFSASQDQERRAWASALAQTRPCEVALVMPATMKATDLLAAARQYDPFRPTLLAFAQVDQTESLCACLALAISSGLPVGYLSSGQEIPEDLETPSAAEFLRRAAPAFQRELAWVS